MLSLQESVVMSSSEGAQANFEQRSRRQAVRQLWSATAQGSRRRFWKALTGQKSRLKNLHDRLAGVKVLSSHYAGVKTIPLDKITGSEGRGLDFDAAFFPLRMHNEERWIGVAAARIAGEVLPPVELLQVGEEYYVRDGHHRLSVARAFGQKEIEAEVTAIEVA